MINDRVVKVATGPMTMGISVTFNRAKLRCVAILNLCTYLIVIADTAQLS